MDAVDIRLKRLERDMYDVQQHKASRRDLDGLNKAFDELVNEVRSMRRTLFSFALTVAVSAVGVALAVLTSTA